MENLEYRSFLNKDMKSELEALLFFNPEQNSVIDGIISSIEEHGQPAIVDFDKDKIRIEVGKLENVQNIFAILDEEGQKKVVAVMLFFRENKSIINLLHVSINSEFSSRSNNSANMLLMKLILKLKEIARSLKGVESIKIFYQNGRSGIINV